MLINPISQGAVESFNKRIQRFLEFVKLNKQKINLKDSVNNFLYYYNGVVHSTTKMDSYKIIMIMNDEVILNKVSFNTKKQENR